MSSTLQEAYTALMSRAPGAAFRRARSLYLNKYPLPQPDQNGPLRLFVCQERCEELEQPAPDGVAHHRLVTLTCRPGELALVHWQQPEAAMPGHAVRCEPVLRAPSSQCAASRAPHVAVRPPFRATGTP